MRIMIQTPARLLGIIAFLACLLILGVIPIQAKTLQLYLLTGQSNSLGAVKGSPASGALLQQYQSNGSTKFWHQNFNKDSGKPVDLEPPPSTSWEKVAPQVCGAGNAQYNCMGPEYGFAYIMEKNKWKLAPSSGNSQIDIGIIKASLDGGAKEYWHKGTPAYGTIIRTIREALSKARSDGYEKIQFVGVMYLQGESNTNSEKVKEDFLDFLNNLEQEIAGFGVDTTLLKKQQAILGEHALWGSSNITDPETGDVTAGNNGNAGKAGNTSEQHKNLVDSRKNMGWVPTRDLAKITKGDGMGVHYDGKSQLTIGARFAYEAARLAGYDTGCVRNGNTSVPLSSPLAWTNSTLPLKSPAIWNLASSAKINMTGESTKEKAALYGITIDHPYLNAITIRGIMDGKTPTLKDSFVALGKGGINISPENRLNIEAVLLLSGKQQWNMHPGSAIYITSCDKNPAKGTLVTGSGDISICMPDENPSATAASVTIDLAESSGSKPYTGNWHIGPNIKLTINGTPSAAPSIILNTLTLNLNPKNNEHGSGAPHITISGSNFIIKKGIILDVSESGKPASSQSFQIINPENNELLKTLNKAKFSLSPRSKAWKIDSFDSSTGIITLSPSTLP